jgi:phage gp36-like protein
MPVYAQVDDLVSRFGQAEIVQLTDRATPPAGAIDNAVAQRALTDADAEIDAYIASIYTLPLSSVPPVLSRIACDIARYRLWDDQAPEEVRSRYEDARRLLEAIAAGRVTLTTSQSAGTVQYHAPTRIMKDLEY